MKHKNYMPYVVLSAVIFGFLFNEVGALLKPYLVYILAVLTFFSLFRVKLIDLAKSIKKPKEQIFIFLIQFLVTPFIVFLFKPILTPELFTGLIIASVIPVGLTALFLTSIFKGKVEDTLLSIMASHLLSPLIVPALVLFWAGSSVNISFMTIALLIFNDVLIPIFFVQVWHLLKIKDISESIRTKGTDMLLFLVIWPVVSAIKGQILADPLLLLKGLIVSFVCLFVNFLLGYFSQREETSRITTAVTSSNKNFTLATVVASSFFGPAVVLGTIAYTLANSFFFGIEGWLLNLKLLKGQQIKQV
ncbi:MAG: bile acid:sodium symporter [Patescibacteria group bacterium]|nr:bile acid:sodium symporter [Patescibacteria group bacterium]MCL5093782.1 bile acid:sodium symporter [Patescibacteria group bacterium]